MIPRPQDASPEHVPPDARGRDVEVGVHTALPCGLLIHEVLSNCLQHPLPGGQGGAITITLRAEPPGAGDPNHPGHGHWVPADLDRHLRVTFGLPLVRP